MGSIYKRGGKKNRGGYYYIEWNDWTSRGAKRKSLCTRTTDRSAAERILKEKEALAALRREGVVDPRLENLRDQRLRSLDDHLVDYENELRAARRSETHVRKTIGFIRQAARHCRWHAVADVESDRLAGFAASRLDAGTSARTVQAMLTATKSFTRWLLRTNKLSHDPLTGLKKPNPAADRRKRRRMLLPEEWTYLDAATRLGRTLGSMSGEERALLYWVAIETSMRASELASLNMSDVHLRAERPFVTCGAGDTKNRKPARQFIIEALAERLKQHAAACAERRRLFRIGNLTNLPRVLLKDLAEARARRLFEADADPRETKRRTDSDFLLPLDREGKSLDFHALRHTCGAWHAQAGAHPKVVQTVMRHSSIALTMDTYGHLFPGDEAEAVTWLAAMLQDRPNQAAQQGKNPRLVQGLVQSSEREPSRDRANGRDEDDALRSERPRRKKLAVRKLREPVRLAASERENRAGLIRTDDQGIMRHPATAENAGETADSEAAAAQATVDAIETSPASDGFADLLRQWGSLDPALQAGLLAMIRTAGGSEEKR